MTRKETVLVIADFDETGGTGTYLRRLVEYLAPRYDVCLSIRKDQSASELIPVLEDLGAKVAQDLALFPSLDAVLVKIFRRLGLLLFYLHARDFLARVRLERTYRPGLICISQGGGCRYFAYLKSRRPLLMVMHSLFTQSISEMSGGALYVKLFARMQEQNKGICLVSGFARELFQRNIRSSAIASVARVVPNYGELPSGRVEHRGGPITVLTLGHLVGYKNPRTWLATAMELRKTHRDGLRFVWAGDGEFLKELQAQSHDTSIEFRGFVRDTSKLYREADIYFQPSLWESQGISVVEAMAYSLPCVVSSAGGLPESIEDGVEGFVREPMDLAGYVEALSLLIEDAGRRKSMGAKGRLKFESLFTKERWIENMDATLGELLGEKE